MKLKNILKNSNHIKKRLASIISISRASLVLVFELVPFSLFPQLFVVMLVFALILFGFLLSFLSLGYTAANLNRCLNRRKSYFITVKINESK